MKKNLITFFIFLLAAITLFGLYSMTKNRFPVTYKVCDANYQSCNVIAKFKDRYDCEITNKKWGWYCDQTDKSNIKCQEKESKISVGYCE